jgi:uncharacterized damage-inducible protein DinB
MLNDYFIRLYHYNDWANRQVLELLEKNNVTNEFAIKNFSHVINAQFIWLRRVAGHQNSYKIWEVLSFEQMHQSLDECHRLWLEYLQKATPEEFTRVFSYSNSAGDAFHSVVLDCVAHNVNHATYHRAQVAKALRDISVIPVNTDYITYCRNVGNDWVKELGH